MFPHWWKRKGQKRQECSSFCHPELFLKVCLDLNEWVAPHLYNTVPCSETPAVVAGPCWTHSTHRSQVGIWLGMHSASLPWGTAPGCGTPWEIKVMPSWVVCLGEKADVQQWKTCVTAVFEQSINSSGVCFYFYFPVWLINVQVGSVRSVKLHKVRLIVIVLLPVCYQGSSEKSWHRYFQNCRGGGFWLASREDDLKIYKVLPAGFWRSFYSPLPPPVLSLPAPE